MSRKLKIALVSDMGAKLDYPPALRCLQTLETKGLIELKEVLLNQGGLHTFNALILRPKWGGELEDKHVKGLLTLPPEKHRFCVATLSVSASKIKLEDERIKKRVGEIIHARYGNLDSTAELAIWMAITLRRRLQFRCAEVGLGYWNNQGKSNNLGGLKGTTWSFLGGGKLASRLLGRLVGMGVRQVKIWHDQAPRAKFVELLGRANLPDNVPDSDGAFSMRVPGDPSFAIDGTKSEAGREAEILFTNQLEIVLRGADVVCVLLGNEPATRGRRSTIGLIKEDHLKLLKPTTILINVGRAEVLDASVYRQLYPTFRYFGKGGFGSDLLEENLEDLKRYAEVGPFETHLLWKAFGSTMISALINASESQTSQKWATIGRGGDADRELGCQTDPFPNVFLSPHIGGATPESEAMIAEEVVTEVAKRLGILGDYKELQ